LLCEEAESLILLSSPDGPYFFVLTPKSKQKKIKAVKKRHLLLHNHQVRAGDLLPSARSFPVLLSDCFDSDCLFLKAFPGCGAFKRLTDYVGLQRFFRGRNKERRRCGIFCNPGWNAMEPGDSVEQRGERPCWKLAKGKGCRGRNLTCRWHENETRCIASVQWLWMFCGWP